MENCENSFEFWIDKQNEYSILSQLALRLCSINSSSAFIDCRFQKEKYGKWAILACSFSFLNNLTLI